MRSVMAGIQSAHALEASDCVVRAAERDKRGAAIIMRGDVAGLARNGVVEQRARVGLAALCRSNDTEVVDDGGMAGRKRERRAIVRFGLPEAAGAVMRGCKRNKLAECFARRHLRYSGGPPALTTLQDSPRHRVNPLLTSLARSANGTFRAQADITRTQDTARARGVRRILRTRAPWRMPRSGSGGLVALPQAFRPRQFDNLAEHIGAGRVRRQLPASRGPTGRIAASVT